MRGSQGGKLRATLAQLIAKRRQKNIKTVTRPSLRWIDQHSVRHFPLRSPSSIPPQSISFPHPQRHRSYRSQTMSDVDEVTMAEAGSDAGSDAASEVVSVANPDNESNNEDDAPEAKKGYPGAGLSLRFQIEAHETADEDDVGKTFYRVGAHASCPGANSRMLPVREVAMLLLMDKLSDKPNWYEKVFDDEIVANWRQEALTQDEEGLYATIMDGKDMSQAPKPTRIRIITERAFDYVCPMLNPSPTNFPSNVVPSALPS